MPPRWLLCTTLQEDMALDWIESLPEPGDGLDQMTNDILREASLQYGRPPFSSNESFLTIKKLNLSRMNSRPHGSMR
ncbi:hypothetical protein ACA29_05870 [Lederbergia galactosidilytica]|uniref:Uncharacterized protein n=1 Tax=Lederbergia galactosidilytica TaxID=217031 RepID=A0A0Q9Y0W5_9BACI|nr:hypothetical protein ACA29_05870 [Lederbergia galactosidilytica]